MKKDTSPKETTQGGQCRETGAAIPQGTVAVRYANGNEWVIYGQNTRQWNVYVQDFKTPKEAWPVDRHVKHVFEAFAHAYERSFRGTNVPPPRAHDIRVAFSSCDALHGDVFKVIEALEDAGFESKEREGSTGSHSHHARLHTNWLCTKWYCGEGIKLLPSSFEDAAKMIAALSKAGFSQLAEALSDKWEMFHS